MAGAALDRDDIISGLRDLVSELRAAGEIAGIRLVGGAALALRYFDRGTTQDLDTLHIRPGWTSPWRLLPQGSRIAEVGMRAG